MWVLQSSLLVVSFIYVASQQARGNQKECEPVLNTKPVIIIHYFEYILKYVLKLPTTTDITKTLAQHKSCEKRMNYVVKSNHFCLHVCTLAAAQQQP